MGNNQASTIVNKECFILNRLPDDLLLHIFSFLIGDIRKYLCIIVSEIKKYPLTFTNLDWQNFRSYFFNYDELRSSLWNSSLFTYDFLRRTKFKKLGYRLFAILYYNLLNENEKMNWISNIIDGNNNNNHYKNHYNNHHKNNSDQYKQIVNVTGDFHFRKWFMSEYLSDYNLWENTQLRGESFDSIWSRTTNRDRVLWVYKFSCEFDNREYVIRLIYKYRLMSRIWKKSYNEDIRIIETVKNFCMEETAKYLWYHILPDDVKLVYSVDCNIILMNHNIVNTGVTKQCKCIRSICNMIKILEFVCSKFLFITRIISGHQFFYNYLYLHFLSHRYADICSVVCDLGLTNKHLSSRSDMFFPHMATVSAIVGESNSGDRCQNKKINCDINLVDIFKEIRNRIST
jgi:hypothetical protein